MNRRGALKWISGLFAAACTLVVAIPGVSFVAEALRRGPRKKSIVQRVARLQELPQGRPVQANIVGSRRDAWTVYPDEVIGRVWLVRQTDDSVPESEHKVAAFTGVCPHLGCAILKSSDGENFVCPCHKAAFALDGEPLSEDQLGHTNHTPRGMDSLTAQPVQDEAGQWWVEVEYKQFVTGLTKKVQQV